MSTLTEVFDALDRVIADAPLEDVPTIIGCLELARRDAIERVRPAGQALSTEQDNDILLMPEVAKLLRRNVETVREWGRKGSIPTIPLGKRGVGVRRGALHELLRAQEKRVVKRGPWGRAG